MQRCQSRPFQSYASLAGCNNLPIVVTWFQSYTSLTGCNFATNEKIKNALRFQSYASLAGCNFACHLEVAPTPTFNLTHPLRGATGAAVVCTYLSSHFQSYASLAGCNIYVLNLPPHHVTFNLTHPLRGATAILYITRIIFLCVIVHFYWYGLFNAVVAYLLHRIHPQSLLFIGAKFPVNLCEFDVRTSHIQYYYTIFYISVLTLTFSPRLKQGVLRRTLINKKSNKRNSPLVALFYFGYL